VRLIQYEMLRAAESSEGHLPVIMKRFNRPISQRVQRIITDGMAQGEFRKVDAQHAKVVAEVGKRFGATLRA